MPKRRLVAALAMLSTMLAACYGGPNSSLSAEPTSTAAPTPQSTSSSATPTTSASATPTSSPAPPFAAGCTPIDRLDLSKVEVTLGSVDSNGNGGDIGISVGRLGAMLDMTRITELSGPRRSVTPAESGRQHERGLLLGGHEFIAFPSTWFDGHVNPQAMISASVALTLDGHAPVDLATRFVPGNENFDQFAVSVPDTAGAGVLSLALVWADPCFRYEASAAVPVDVVPLSVTAGCALGSESYYDQIAALLDGSLRVGSTAVHAFSPMNQSKFLPWDSPGIDAFIEYSFDPDDSAIVAAPGTALTIELVSGDITLGNDMTLKVWTRASIARAIRDYPPQGTVLVLSRTPVKQPDGTFRLRVPEDPGRYVAGVMLSYDSQCSSGALWFVVNIDVVAPTPSASPSPSPAT